MTRDIVRKYSNLRHTHPAWQLLTSPKSALIITSLRALVESSPNGVEFEDAVERLATVYADHEHNPDFDLGSEHASSARRDLRDWLKRGLIVERNGQVLATDAFQRSVHFIDSLHDNAMTSTASRLGTVQRAIESLESQLSPNQEDRERSLQARINTLTEELKAVQAGNFEVLDGPKAIEGIREVFQLATSLKSDFRRVEDSYREADRTLRHRILSDNQNRGAIVDELLDGNDQLVQTAEGQVFESFHAQLVRSDELHEMKTRLRSILENKNTDAALDRKQRSELRSIVSRLVQESERVIQARARSERDVRNFLKSGLADEQLKVGMLLQEIFQAALQVDWQSQKIRRSDSPLPAIAPNLSNLPIAERLLPKQLDTSEPADLEWIPNEADPTHMDIEFWNAYNALNRSELFEKTIAQLKKKKGQMTIGALVNALPPTHDLETLAYWLSMARQAGIDIGDEIEVADITNAENETTRFQFPAVGIELKMVQNLEPGSLE